MTIPRRTINQSGLRPDALQYEALSMSLVFQGQMGPKNLDEGGLVNISVNHRSVTTLHVCAVPYRI